MLTPQEAARLSAIKTMALAGNAGHVSSTDKQWVLNIVAREKIAVRKSVVASAAKEGFNVQGLVVA